ncbi:MAG TPA: tetratricopeptide repeat protein [Candidatus Polarisedimenticolia bacterium]|nr:tetratricopeptide repeat protein [Candidatus Polarisedimenticolia bacterium]
MKRVFCVAVVLAAFAPAWVSARETPAGGPAEAALSEGDREFARENYDAAEARYREEVSARPDDIHALTRLGLLLSWKGAYKESIGFYTRALALDPTRLETRRGLATVYAWSGDFDAAMALYREMLAERPGDEGLSYEMAQAQTWSGDNGAAKRTLHALIGRNARHVKARVLLAQVHAYDGETGDAEKIYRSVLAEEPNNVDALAGLGEVLSWKGAYAESLAQYDKALAVDPKNRRALEGRAQVFHWEGRTPEALDAIRRALELYPDARDARRLGSDIGGALRPSLQLFATTTQDSDDNDLATWGGTYTHYIGAKGYAGVTFTHAQTDALVDTDSNGASVPSRTPLAQYDTLRLIGGWHVSRHLSLYAEAGGERTSFPLTDVDPTVKTFEESRDHAAGSITVEVNAGDWFTLVAGGAQERLVGTSQAFMNDVGIRSGTLTTIFRPHPSLRLRLTGQKAVFTDARDLEVGSTLLFDPNGPEPDGNNGRDLVTAGAAWRLPLKRPKLMLNYNFRWMSYDQNLDQGYFDPDHFILHTAGFDISDTIGKHFYWGGGADRGIQRINDADNDDVFGYRVLAGVNIGSSLSVEGYYSRTDSAAQTTAGFKSTDAGLRVKMRFGHPLGPAAPAKRGPLERSGTTD